jgi:hypothetical protein
MSFNDVFPLLPIISHLLWKSFHSNLLISCLDYLGLNSFLLVPWLEPKARLTTKLVLFVYVHVAQI